MKQNSTYSPNSSGVTMKPFYEVVAARTYYGKHATGAVLLRNGYPEYHGSWAEARRTLKLAQEGWKAWR
jgi:hypothetical protein